MSYLYGLKRANGQEKAERAGEGGALSPRAAPDRTGDLWRPRGRLVYSNVINSTLPLQCPNSSASPVESRRLQITCDDLQPQLPLLGQQQPQLRHVIQRSDIVRDGRRLAERLIV